MDRDIYTDSFQGFISFSDEKRQTAEIIKRYLKESGAVSMLDVGAGDGTLCSMLKGAVKDYVAIEPNDVFQKKLKDIGIDLISDKYPCVVDRKFDVILFSHSFSLKKYSEYLEYAKKILSDDGVIFIVMCRGKNDDWSTLLRGFDNSLVEDNIENYNRLVSVMDNDGTIWFDSFTTYLRCDNLIDLKNQLAFLYADGSSEKISPFMQYLDMVTSHTLLKYKFDAGPFRFPILNNVLVYKPFATNKKSVFLLGDIGVGEDGYYHVGDEAMFSENVNFYKNAGYQVYGSSRSLSHCGMGFHESLDIYLSTSSLLRIICAVILYRTFNTMFLLPSFFRKSVSNLSRCEILHISGGGNMNSFWPGHIYYRTAMVFCAWLFGLKIVLKSQTLGPFNSWWHWFLITMIVRIADEVSVRDLLSLNLAHRSNNKVELSVDDARWLAMYVFDFGEIDGTRNIALSLHGWNKDTAVLDIVNDLLKVGDRVYLIPHVFSHNVSSDLSFMGRIIKHSNLVLVDLNFFLNKGVPFCMVPHAIKYMYSKMDMVITTRYHGLVFAASSGVETYIISYDKYYLQKNRGFLEHSDGVNKNTLLHFIDL